MTQAAVTQQQQPQKPQQLQQTRASQDIKSLLVKYYESKRVIPHLISQANQAQLTLDESFISLKLMDDDQSNKDSSVTVEKLLEEPQGGQKKQLGMVIKGGPGSGKSTLLDKIAYTWAKDVKSTIKKVTFDYVFRIDLKKLGTAKVSREQNFSKLIFYSLIQAFQQKQAKNTNKQERQQKLIDELSTILNRGKFYKFMFLLDGYDQVKHFQGDQSLSQSSNLAKIFQNVKNYNTIITSRPQATQGSKSLEDFKRIIEIQPLDEASINNFINIMFEKNQDRVKGEDLKRQAKSNKNVMKIMQSPLNLTMVCLIFLNQTGTTKGIDLQVINEIFLYDKIIKMITLRQENKGYTNDLNRQDLQKTVAQGTLYEEIEPLNLLKETVYNVFKTGILIIKKEDIGKSSNKKYDEKRKAIRRTIDFGLLKKKNENKGKDLKKAQQDEQYTFIHLSFAEYLFAYSIFEKLKKYIPSNNKNETKTSTQQLQQITSFIANNRYKTSFLNSFRHLTMLCSKYYNQQKVRNQNQALTKTKKLAQKINSTNKEKEDDSRYFTFPLETVWICFACNIDGVIEFGKQQRLKLVIEMVGLSNYNHFNNQLAQNSKIQILNTVKSQFIQPYFSLTDPAIKEANKKAIVRWHKYFINSNYFPSKLTQQLVKQVQNYLPNKEGVINNIITKLDEDFIVAFCLIVSCVINSKTNNYFHNMVQNKLKCLQYFMKLLEIASVKHEKISFAILSSLQDIFQSLEQKDIMRLLFQYKKEGQKEFDLIQILLHHLGSKQLNQITFKLLCYFAKQQQQIKQKYIKIEQQKKSNTKKAKGQLLLMPKNLEIANSKVSSKNQKSPFSSEQILNFIKISSIKKRILLALKQELIKVLTINLDNRDLEQSKIFQELTSEKLKPSDPTQAKQSASILQEIKKLYIEDTSKKIQQILQIETKKQQAGIVNDLIKQKMFIFFKYYEEQQLKKGEMRELMLKLDKKNTQCQIISAAQQTTNSMTKHIFKLIGSLLHELSSQQKYFASLKQFYLNRNIVNGYGHFIKGNILIVLLQKLFQDLKKIQNIQIQNLLIGIVFKIFENLLKFMEKDEIIKGVDLIVNHYMDKQLGKKLFQSNFQKGVVLIFRFFQESFPYIGKQQIKKHLSKIVPSLQILAKVTPKHSTVQRVKSDKKKVNKKAVVKKFQQFDGQLAELIKRQKKQTKQNALIAVIEFLEQTISYNTEEVMINIMKNIIMPLCTFYNLQNDWDFFYDNPVKQAAMSFIKSPFSMIKSQNLLISLKQLSVTLYPEKKLQPQPKQKIPDQFIASKSVKDGKKKPKDIVKEDKQYITLEILGTGIIFLKQRQRILLIESQLFLFQKSSQRQFYQVGVMIMSNQLYRLEQQNKQYLYPIYFHLLNSLSDKGSKSSPQSIINFLTEYMPQINNTKIKSQLLEKLIDVLSKKEQLFQSALKLLILCVPYLRDQEVRLTIIKSIIPFLAAKKKKIRMRTYQFLKYMMDIPYSNGDAISTVYQTAEILEKKLYQKDRRSKINAMLIIKEILPLLAYHENNTFIQKVMNAIVPMIEDQNVQVAKHAINFVGSAISIIKQSSKKYFDKTFKIVYKLLKSDIPQLAFNAIQYMKKILPNIGQGEFMSVFQSIIYYLQNKQKQIYKCSDQVNQQLYTKKEKTLYNMAFNYFNASLQYINQKIFLQLWSELVRNEDKKKRKLYPNMVKAVNTRANQFSYNIIQDIIIKAERVIDDKNETLQIRAQTIQMIQIIFNPSNPQHKNIAKGSVYLVKKILINEEMGIKLPLISLIKKTSVCLEKQDSKIAIQLMIRLLSDKDDEVRAAVMEDNDLKIKQSALQSITNFLPSLSQVKQYRQIIDRIMKLINKFIKSRHQNTQVKPNQSNMKQQKQIKNEQNKAMKNVLQIEIKTKQNDVNQAEIKQENHIVPEKKQSASILEEKENQYTLYRSIINFIHSIFPNQKNEQLQLQLLKTSILPAFSDKNGDFHQITKKFLQKSIEQKKINQQKVIKFIIAYLKDCSQIDTSFLIVLIKQNYIQYQTLVASKEMIVQIVPFFNKFNQDTHAKIQQLIKSSSINMPCSTLYQHVIGRQIYNSNKLTYDKIYFLGIIIQKATRQQAQKISKRVVGQSNDENIEIRQKVRNIIKIAIPKIAQNKRVDLIKPVLQDISKKQEQQKKQMLSFLTNCIPFLNSKVPDSYFKTFQEMLNDKSNSVRAAAIKFMEKSLQQCIKKPQQRQPLVVKLKPLFITKHLGFENSVNFVQMVHNHLNEKDKQDLLKQLQPFLEQQNAEQFLKRVKSVENILSQLDSSIKTIILNKANYFLSDKQIAFKTAVQIIHTTVSVFSQSQKLSFQMLLKLIPHLKHEDQQIQKKVTHIIKMGIFYQKEQNRALLMLNIMILYSQDKNEKDPNNTIDYSKIQFGSSVTVPIDKLMKMKSLEFDLNLLHQQSSLMDTIHVAIQKNKIQNVVTLFGKMLSIKGVLERQSGEIVKLLSQNPSLNGTVAEKIKSRPQDFKGHNFTILIELSKANNYIYGVISQFCVQILDLTEKDIIKQGANSKILKQLQQKIKKRQIDCQSFFTQQLLKRIVMIRLRDKDLSKQDTQLLSICIQCDLTISFRYHYDENKENFQNKYEAHYSIDMGDKRFLIKEGNQNLFAILRKLFSTQQGTQYAKHNNIFINNERNGLKKAAIDTVSCKDIFLDHKKIINKLFNEKIKMQQQILLTDWDKINLLHLTYQQNNEYQDIYFIVRRDEFGNITVRKFQNQKTLQTIKECQSHHSHFENYMQKQQQSYIQAQNKKDNKYIKKEKQYKDYILHLSQFNQCLKAFKSQLFGQKNDDRKNIYNIQCFKISLENYEASYYWCIKKLKQFVRKISVEPLDKFFQGKFPKWVLLGQAIKPYQLAAQDIQNIDQILQITGIAAKSKLKKALKKLGKTPKEKELLAQYTKVAYWKLTNMVQSYGLVDCGILKKDDQYRTRDDQYKKEDIFISAADFFGDKIESIPTFGPLAKSCIDFLSKKATANIDRKQTNQKTAFVQLFQESSANVEERNLLIDEVILQLTKKRMMVLFSQQQQDKIPFLFDVFYKVNSIKDKIDNLLLEEQLQTKLSGKRTSLMAKMDIATLAMAIMNKQSQIVEQCPQRQQIPSLLMTYLDEQIDQDEKTQKTGCMARIKKCLLVYENCCRLKSNVNYQYRELTCWQRVKTYLGACFCCCNSNQVKVSDQISQKLHQQTTEQMKLYRKADENQPTISRIHRLK